MYSLLNGEIIMCKYLFHSKKIRLLGSAVIVHLLLVGCSPGPNPSTVSNATILPTYVWSVAFSPDGHSIAAGYGGSGGDDVVRVWDFDTPTNKPIVLNGHTSQVNGVAFSPDGHSIASISEDDHTARLWDLQNPSSATTVLTGSTSLGNAIAFSSDGNTLATGGDDEGIVRLWDLSQPTVSPVLLRGKSNSGASLSFSPDGSMLAAAEGEAVRVWYLHDLKDGPRELHPYGGPLWAVAFSPDSFLLAEGGVDKIVRVWDLRLQGANPPVIRLEGHIGTVKSLAFSPDGLTLASASDDGTIRLWNVQQPQVPPMILVGHKGPVSSVAFSPNGQTLVSGGADGTLRLWEVKQPQATPVILSVAPNP